jgi:hypothetical protein
MANKKYAVSDPRHGVVHFCETEQIAKERFFQLLFDFAMPYFGAHPYVEITTNDDGSETWRNIEGDEIENVLPRGAIEERFADLRNHVRVMSVKDNHPKDQPRPHVIVTADMVKPLDQSK